MADEKHKYTKPTKDEERILKQYNHLAHLLTNKFCSKNKYYTQEDVFQTAQIGILKAARTFDPTRGIKFITYCYSCISNELTKTTSIGPIRSPYLQLSKIPDVHLLTGKVEESLELDFDISDYVDSIDMEELLGYLNENQKKVVIMYFYEGYSKKEIAEKLGITEKSANKWYKSALQTLKWYLENES